MRTYKGFCTAVNVRRNGPQMQAVTAKHCTLGQNIDIYSFNGRVAHGPASVVKTFSDAVIIQYTPALQLEVYETTTEPPPGSDIWLVGASR
ncbi:MAG: hypothetical protein J3T61_11875, partial [Candidatus Brocadiales bacterium]|nr:hypothetical protein [Candidatus Bathyanammoxibius sp.]